MCLQTLFALQNTGSFEDLVVLFLSPDILHGGLASFKTRSILSFTNAPIDTTNAHALNILPGDLHTACSCDSVDPDATVFCRS